MSPEAATRAEGPDPLIGKVLDERYRIETPLGQGGIGRVYKARHLILGHHIALKVLLAQYESIPVLQERFRREGQALAALSHPNIVTVTDFGVAEGMPYLAMELLEGEDLASLLERDVLEPRRGLAIVRQMLRALAYAHSRDLVHRDLKPHNVFVRELGDGTDHATVLDFGLARFMGDAANRGPKLTRVGALIGTPAYMAPEQASGEAVDARADVYASGLVLFETLTGRKPFEHREPGEMLRSHLLATPPRVGQGDTGLQVSEGLETLVSRALAKSPAARFTGAAEMFSALDALGPDPVVRVGPRPPRDQPIRSVAVTQAGLAAAARAGTPATFRSRVIESSVHLPKNRLTLFIGVGCAGGIIVGAAIAAGVWLSSFELDDRPPAPHGVGPNAPLVAPAPTPPAPPQQQAVPARPAARNPFEPPPTEPELRSNLERVRAGRAVSVEDINGLSRFYGRSHDVRALLLVAHGHMSRRTLTIALSQYQQVHELDPSMRGDPLMLSNLLEIARVNEEQLRASAADFVVDAYGTEALTLIERQLATERRLSRDERARLEALRARIAGAPPAP